MTEPQQTEQVPEGELVCLPVAEHDALTALVRDLAASDPLYEAPNGWFCAYCDAPGSEEQAIRMRGSESWPHHASCSWLAARRFAGSGSK